MGSNLLIAFIFGIGFGGWVFSKIQRKTGGNTQSSLTVAAIAGFAGLIVLLLILQALPFNN